MGVAAAPAVVDALVDGVLCSAQVEAAEYRQVCALMAGYMFREENSFILEMVRSKRWVRAFEAPALLAAAGRPPAEMTRDDALTVAADMSFLMMITRGWTRTHEAAGVDEMSSVFELASHPLYPERAAANPGGNERLIVLALEICRDPQGLSERQLAGVWNCLFLLVTQRAELGAAAAKGGIFDAAAAELRELEHCLRVACANDRLTRMRMLNCRQAIAGGVGEVAVAAERHRLSHLPHLVQHRRDQPTRGQHLPADG